MSETAWPGHVILIQRNLTVQSSQSDQRLINYTRVWGKVWVAPGVSLVFKNVIMAGMSIGSSFAFIAASPGAVVIMHGGAWKAPVCPPFGAKMMQIFATHPRPEALPGEQRVGFVKHPFCIDHSCYKHVFQIYDWASAQPLVQDELELGAYVSHMTNLVWACDVKFTDACIVRKGYEICRKEMLALYLRGVSNTYDGRTRRAIRILAAVACVVLSAAVAAFANRTRLFRPRGSPFASSQTSPSTSMASRHASGRLEKVPLSAPPSPCLRWLKAVGQSTAADPLNCVELGPLLGMGSFGCVYQARWQGQAVAVKMIGHDRQSAKAISSEAAVSMSVVHPNVVRTFHHFTQLDGALSRRPSFTPASPPPGGELGAAAAQFSQFSTPSGRLPMVGEADKSPEIELAQAFSYDQALPRRTWIVLELCDLGALPQHMQRVQPRTVAGNLEPALMLGYALDIAQGMAYLHSLNICHGDLKACNTLVSSGATPLGRATCKVADFGLSRIMSAEESHLSTLTIGTVTHMPPELLLEGHLTKECDVYSYGILLWELATAGQALYPKMKPAQIINKVVTFDMRPEFPTHVSQDFVNLASDCWARDMLARPAFPEVVVRLQGMLKRATSVRRGGSHLGGSCPPPSPLRTLASSTSIHARE